MTAGAAVRAGAGYVRWSSVGETPGGALKPLEVVGTGLPAEGWADEVLADVDRFGAVTVGNGLGLDPAHTAQVAKLVGRLDVPVVVDADALTLLGHDAASATRSTTIVTPHDGEYTRLAGHGPGPDRIAAARELAGHLGCVVLLKGPATVVASPDGRALLATSGDERLATLGSGDVLAGVIGGFCAMGVPPFEAAAAAAHVHGRAAQLGWGHGLVAPDLVETLPLALDDLLGPG
jgi:hydroxyethylthiazole kinase-like uncharacterized protein yjeF